MFGRHEHLHPEMDVAQQDQAVDQHPAAECLRQLGCVTQVDVESGSQVRRFGEADVVLSLSF